jgi:hypothetical protein
MLRRVKERKHTKREPTNKKARAILDLSILVNISEQGHIIGEESPRG